jgi:hypothetical protein
MAEMAWQQDEDLYSYKEYALAAALELHARIINAFNAGKNESALPPNFRWVENMPAPPAGSSWSFDTKTQLWSAYSNTNGAKVTTLMDGKKYVVGAWALPTGWEVAYNHYVGRLGLSLPETQRFIRNRPQDWFSFHWGLGTLTHADSASMLWRNAVATSTSC